MLIRSRASSVCLVASLLVLAGPVLGQKPGVGAKDGDPAGATPNLNAQKAELTQRNRGTMHPGAALTLVGTEQGGNDIRSRTPALENSDRASAPVKPDDNYRRALALYSDGARFQSAPPTISDPKAAPRKAATPRRLDSHEQSGSEGHSWMWGVGFVASALVGWWGYRRFAQRS